MSPTYVRTYLDIAVRLVNEPTLTFQQIADETGVSRQAIEQHVRKLCKIYENEGKELPPWLIARERRARRKGMAVTVEEIEDAINGKMPSVGIVTPLLRVAAVMATDPLVRAGDIAKMLDISRNTVYGSLRLIGKKYQDRGMPIPTWVLPRHKRPHTYTVADIEAAITNASEKRS